MGDVLRTLLPKREIVVNRLRRRFELYRKHQNACLPRYEQASNGLYEAQRQETLLLKQRFLESKTKKSKNHKSDPHRSNLKDSTADGPKAQSHPKPVKRVVEESPITSTQDGGPAEDLEKPSKAARTEKTAPFPSEKKTEQQQSNNKQQQQQPSIPNLSVHIVQQFNTSQAQHTQTIQTNVTVQALTQPAAPTKTIETKTEVLVQQDNQQFPGVVPIPNGDIECKQEKDTGPDLCQCRSQSSSSGNGGDRLSDTFPSLGFAEDSGDDVIHPDLLKDLIEDVFTNSADIMKDFNFEDSVGSIKDQEDAAKDIIELIKGSPPAEMRTSQTDGLNFVSGQVNHQQQNGLFENAPTSDSTAMSIMTTTSTTTAPVTTSSSFYGQQHQRLPSYGVGGSGLPINGGLGLDFKLTEPSPAALTLKQMAEQHQNMQHKQQQQQQQQQQIVTSPLSNRPAFNQDVFANHLNPMRTNYLDGGKPVNQGIPSNSDQAPKNPNPGSLFNGYEAMSSYPGVIPINANLNSNATNAGGFKQEEQATTPAITMMHEDSRPKQRLQKPPAYGATRPLTHYSDAMGHHHQQGGHQHHPVHSMATGQFTTNPEQRLQMSQSQQMHVTHNAQQFQQTNPDLKQQQNMMQPHPNLYNGVYPPAQQQQQNSTDPNLLHVTMAPSLAYPSPPHFRPGMVHNNNNNRPPPEYKAHHQNIANDNSPQMQAFKNNTNYLRNAQRPPNVSISSDGLVSPRTSDWRQTMISSQQAPNRLPSFPHQENYNMVRNAQQQYYQQQYRSAGSHLMNGSNMMGDHLVLQQRQRMSLQLRPRSDIGSPVTTVGPVYSGHHSDISRHQDGSQINLDFLDNIESSASDLLNFDQVMQVSTSHFPLLDDIEILGK